MFLLLFLIIFFFIIKDWFHLLFTNEPMKFTYFFIQIQEYCKIKLKKIQKKKQKYTFKVWYNYSRLFKLFTLDRNPEQTKGTDCLSRHPNIEDFRYRLI